MAIKVCFVCLGNICRSPMAEAVFRQAVEDSGKSAEVSKIDSFGTASYHVGEDPDYRTQAVCKKHGVPIDHRGQKISAKDFDEFDYVICMDHSNEQILQSRKPSGSKAQIRLFGYWRQDPKFSEIVEDPYYGGTGGFEACYAQCKDFSEGFIKKEL